MVFKLDPLEVTLAFERRGYRLGDTINATVTLVPSSDVVIRTASLNLVVEGRRTESRMGRTMGVGGGARALQGGNAFTTTDFTPMQQATDEEAYTEVCYRESFLDSTSLREGVPSRHNVALEIGPGLPRPALEARELQHDANSSLSLDRWWIEVNVDVARGRDATARHKIDVNLP
jgi:hypothetical protein